MDSHSPLESPEVNTFYSHLSDQNGLCWAILSTETGGFIQERHGELRTGPCQFQPHSSYHIPHNASSDILYRAGNDDSLHGWCVSTMQNHTIRVRWIGIGDIGGATCVKTFDLCWKSASKTLPIQIFSWLLKECFKDTPYSDIQLTVERVLQRHSLLSYSVERWKSAS